MGVGRAQRPADILVFSARNYYRLVEIYNAAVWPAHLVALALGLAIYLAAFIGLPALGLALGRPLAQAEIFALAPDPTALATIGLLLAARGLHWHLLIIPLLWCANTGATLWAMKVPDARVVPALAALAILLAAARALGRGRAGS